MQEIISNQPDGSILQDISIEDLRVEIDDIDKELLQLLSRRMQCAQSCWIV